MWPIGLYRLGFAGFAVFGFSGFRVSGSEVLGFCDLKHRGLFLPLSGLVFRTWCHFKELVRTLTVYFPQLTESADDGAAQTMRGRVSQEQ